ncbi:5-oxoprolinase subunit C family protein [Dyella soli]|uniref:Biotin-dependent carboxyltransferase family protein n=1 Tax=Dyella soli TaxID=522319 RepID=A0A4R0YRN4_9GAMM|nr:biotin-dependent carboxyltransferase family protein [Dyella soli]TCI08804.1 biotin-dependent carboxyltransferase family protein [Dyella soli]
MSVHVLKPGLLSSLQDGGRAGHAALGVGRAGAMDWPAWRLANALVGNAPDAAALEFTLVGPSLRFERAAVIALTGAVVDARVDDQRLPGWTCCVLPAGSVLQLGGMKQGCRGYLAMRGGFAVPLVLGSRSTDLHARIGPFGGRALQAGDVLQAGHSEPWPQLAPGERLQVLPWGLDPRPWFDDVHVPLALLRGHHHDRLDEASQQALFRAAFTISKDSNRTASRLDGQRLDLREPLELISEATLPGTLQLPPSGQPILLQAEAPVTGGYPRIGQLAAVDLARLAQRRPGDAVCFRETTLAEAAQRLAHREQRLRRLIERIERRLESA